MICGNACVLGTAVVLRDRNRGARRHHHHKQRKGRDVVWMFRNIVQPTGTRSYHYRLEDRLNVPGRANFEASWNRLKGHPVVWFVTRRRTRTRRSPTHRQYHRLLHITRCSQRQSFHGEALLPSAIVALAFGERGGKWLRRRTLHPTTMCWPPSQCVEVCRNRRAHLISRIVPCTYALGE